MFGFWMEKKRELLNDTANPLTIQTTKRQFDDLDDTFCHKWLGIPDLVIHFGEFLDIETMKSFSFMNKRIQRCISASVSLARKHLKEIIESTLASTIAEPNFTLQQVKYLYEENKNFCCNGYEHPFLSQSVVPERCIQTKDLFTEEPTAIQQPAISVKVDQALHFKISSKEMNCFHETFNNNPLSDGLKRLISFTNTRVADCHVNSCNVKKFIDFPQLNVTRTSETDEIDSRLWQSVKLTSRLGCMSIKLNPPNNKVQLRSLRYFFHHFERNYLFHRYAQFINWKCFKAAGGAVVQALIAMAEDTIDTTGADLDLFAHGITHEQYLVELKEFEQNLIEEEIKTIKSITNKKVTTYVLIFSSSKQVKVQFIYTCVSANIATILVSFDISAVQIAFNPNKMELIYTPAFLDFLQFGTVAVFDLTQSREHLRHISLRRIIKYQKRGFFNWKIPARFNITRFQKQLNKASRRFNAGNEDWSNGIPIQIGCNAVHFLASRSYPKGIFSKKVCIKSNNHDETNILRMFLRLTLYGFQ